MTSRREGQISRSQKRTKKNTSSKISQMLSGSIEREKPIIFGVKCEGHIRVCLGDLSVGVGVVENLYFISAN